MVNIGIRYVNKEKKCEGVILAGDKGIPSPVGAGDLILECDNFHILGEFPIVFAPAGYSDDSAVWSNFITNITVFLYEKFKPNKFSVFEFTRSFNEFYRYVSDIWSSYYTREELRQLKHSDNSKFDFDFILAGSDGKGESFLYYSRIQKHISIANVRFMSGYVTSLFGASEGMAFLKEILQDKEIPERIAVETAIAILEMLRKIRQDMSPNYQILRLENGEIREMPEELLTKIRGLMDYRWNALWITLKNSLHKPTYLDFVIKKLGG
ncbi:MAG: hypothetical protein ABIL40_08035 [candidate division WOR-3 bacterium]